MIYVVNKKRKLEKVKEDFPNATILDITSTSNMRWTFFNFFRSLNIETAKAGDH